MGRLFWKILFTFWFTFLATGIIVGLTVWWHHLTLQNVAEEVVIRPSSVLAVKAAANTFLFGGTDALRNMLREQQAEAPEDLKVYAVNSRGEELLGRTVSQETLAKVAQSVARGVKPPIARQVTANNETYLLFAPKTGQFAEFKSNRLPTNHINDSTPLLITSGIIMSFLSSFFLAWYFAKPIRSLRNAFKALASGDLSSRAAPSIGSRRDELADLGHDFDYMATQLQSLVAAKRRLLHDVSHELRSPLARLQVSIGLARQQPEKTMSSLERIEHEAARLDKLVGEVLTLSRLESGVTQPMDDYLDILELLDTVVDDARFEAEAMSKQVIFQCDLNDNPVIQGHGELLYRAIENVIRNAIRHTPTNTAVLLTVHRDLTNYLHIIIDDQGKGVPIEYIERIFDPFQRGVNSQTIGNGYGLGLAIAKRAIEHHGGSILASNRVPQGLRVHITLPLNKATLEG